MRTAALLPTPGDPFVVAYWLRNCERVWRDEVDDVYILVNGQGEREIVEFIQREAERIGCRLSWQEEPLGHGQALRALALSCPADTGTVVLIEDDAYVRRAGAIGSALARIEVGETDVIATPRGGMDPEIEAYARAKWSDHDLTSPEGNSGPGLWPCFVFTEIATLRATSMRFESWSWRAGDVIPGLGYGVPRDGMTTDSFTATAFELRGAGLRIVPGPQYKELWDKDLPSGDVPWFHVGGLSNGNFIRYDWDGGGSRPGIGGSNEGLDWAHRIWWWRRCLDTADGILPGLQPRYRERLDRLTDDLGVREQVESWTDTLLPWISWDDSP